MSAVTKAAEGPIARAGVPASTPADDQPLIIVRYKALLTIAILGAALLQILDSTIANVALPHMQATLGATLDTITWILTSYVIAAGIATPITGWLADRIGSRQLFLASTAAFIAASMLCGIAQNLETMVLFRIIQGISGAFIGPLAQALLFNINRKADHARAISMFSTGILIGPILGPIIGGWLTENFNWRWVFYVNVPLGLICLVLLFALLPKQQIRPRGFDLFGFGFLALAISALQLFLDRGVHADWFHATEIWVEIGVAVSCFWIFGVHQLTSRNPLFPMRVLKDRNVIVGGFFGAIMGFLMMSTLAMLPPMMQNLYGYSVIQTGFLMTARGLGVLAVMPLVNYFSPRVDARALIGIGFGITAASLWRMTGWTIEMESSEFMIAGIIQGFGLGLVWVPINLLSFSTLPPQYRTDAASLLNVGRSIGSSGGVALMSFTLASNVQTSHADLAQHITSTSLPIDPNLVASIGSAGDTVMAMIDAQVNQQAAMIAYLDELKMMAIAIFCIIPLVFVLRSPKKAANCEEPPLMME